VDLFHVSEASFFESLHGFIRIPWRYIDHGNLRSEARRRQIRRGAWCDSLKEMRALSWLDLMKGDGANDEAVYGHPPLFRPAVDGWVIPLNYSQTYAKGMQNDVPFLTGNNLDESGVEPQPNIKLVTHVSIAKQKYGALADEFLKLYPASSDHEAGLASNAAARDSSRVSTFLSATE
jgi:para-nitrobenzyl esterase